MQKEAGSQRFVVCKPSRPRRAILPKSRHAATASNVLPLYCDYVVAVKGCSSGGISPYNAGQVNRAEETALAGRSRICKKSPVLFLARKQESCIAPRRVLLERSLALCSFHPIFLVRPSII